MKLFVAVVMFVVVPVVFAENPVPGVTPSTQEDSKAPTGHAQSDQANPGDAAPLKTPTNNPLTNQTATEDSQGKPNPVEKEGGWRPPWVAIVSLLVSLASLWISRRNMLQTDEMRKITERAYLAAENWEIKGDYLVCNVTNKGRTPATLLSGYVEFTAWATPRAAKPETWRKVISDFGVSGLPAELPAQVTVPMQAGTLSNEAWNAVKNERTYTLFVEAHIQYRDAFKEMRTMHFVMEYDARIKDFVIAAERTAEKS